jgi:hypothetical protein
MEICLYRDTSASSNNDLICLAIPRCTYLGELVNQDHDAHIWMYVVQLFQG